jgi:hypothetical protein
MVYTFVTIKEQQELKTVKYRHSTDLADLQKYLELYDLCQNAKEKDVLIGLVRRLIEKKQQELENLHPF